MLRNSKRAEKWKAQYIKNRDLYRSIQKEAEDILSSGNFDITKDHIQHGNMTVNHHSINVAKYSLAISKKLPIQFSEKELVRGALLHDYFLYDWHDTEHVSPFRLHGFFHPGIALKNAEKEYNLTVRERDIIKKHMWPLTVIPPMCREAWVVTTADKWCSLMETVRLHQGHGPRKFKRNKHNMGNQKHGRV